MVKTRIPIPLALANIVLYKSAKTCCVCRRPGIPVQLHHCDDDPSNNDEANIIPLCKICHDDAHTKRALSQNLTTNRQMDFKAKWEIEVANRSSTAMLPASMSNSIQAAMWTFVNHQKLPDILKHYNLVFDKQLLSYLKSRKVVDPFGIPIFQKHPKSDGLITIYDYFEWDDSRRLHSLYTAAIDGIITASNPIELGAIWTKKEIRSIVKPGTICFCIRGFRFNPLQRNAAVEDRKVYATAKNIEIRLLANTRHMYGSSALCYSFSGSRTAAILFIAKEIINEGNKLVITGTPLAMGAGFILSEYKTPYNLRYGWAK